MDSKLYYGIQRGKRHRSRFQQKLLKMWMKRNSVKALHFDCPESIRIGRQVSGYCLIKPYSSFTKLFRVWWAMVNALNWKNAQTPSVKPNSALSSYDSFEEIKECDCHISGNLCSILVGEVFRTSQIPFYTEREANGVKDVKTMDWPAWAGAQESFQESPEGNYLFPKSQSQSNISALNSLSVPHHVWLQRTRTAD